MDKILLKQAQRIIDHIIENKPEDVDWLFVKRYRELLNKHLEKSNAKKNKKNSVQAD